MEGVKRQSEPEEASESVPKSVSVPPLRENLHMRQTTDNVVNPHRSTSHYRIPCAFNPRIQRQWERQHKKEWYSLSPDGRKQAEFEMRSMLNPQTDHPRPPKTTTTNKNPRTGRSLLGKTQLNPKK